MSFVKRVLALAILPLLAPSLSAQDNPEEILRTSVVAIRNDECSGSGMFLDDTGLILTNAHVACSPLPYRVHALATVKGTVKEVVFRKVTLIGFHPEYDLALLRVDPAEQDATVKPVAVASGPPAVHERIWAMGFPGDHNGGKTKVLTWGEVRSTSRDFYGDRYYELDLSVYHGNSGGPLSNSKGQVLGVITMLIEDGALAIPISEVKRERFGPLKNRAPNRTMSSHLIAEADKLIQGPANASSTAQAVMLYEEALLWDASNASLYSKVGQINLTARRHLAAAAYLLRSVQLQPWPDKPEVYRDLGLAFAALKKGEEARATWTEGLKKFPLDNSFLWGELGAALEKERAFYEAACCDRIAIRTFSERAGDVNALYKRVEARLTSEEASKLRDLESRLDDHLGRLRADADRARRDGKLFMTPEAEKVFAGFDGVQQEKKETLTPEVRKLGVGSEPKKTVYSDEELNARFVRSRVEVAKEHARSGRKEKAIEILEDLVATYPSEPETEAGRLLLRLLRKS
jgi:tetratricopeptide (TPR) repeat protein